MLLEFLIGDIKQKLQAETTTNTSTATTTMNLLKDKIEQLNAYNANITHNHQNQSHLVNSLESIPHASVSGQNSNQSSANSKNSRNNSKSSSLTFSNELTKIMNLELADLEAKLTQELQAQQAAYQLSITNLLQNYYALGAVKIHETYFDILLSNLGNELENLSSSSLLTPLHQAGSISSPSPQHFNSGHDFAANLAGNYQSPTKSLKPASDIMTQNTPNKKKIPPALPPKNPPTTQNMVPNSNYIPNKAASSEHSHTNISISESEEIVSPNKILNFTRFDANRKSMNTFLSRSKEQQQERLETSNMIPSEKSPKNLQRNKRRPKQIARTEEDDDDLFGSIDPVQNMTHQDPQAANVIRISDSSEVENLDVSEETELTEARKTLMEAMDFGRSRGLNLNADLKKRFESGE